MTVFLPGILDWRPERGWLVCIKRSCTGYSSKNIFTHSYSFNIAGKWFLTTRNDFKSVIYCKCFTGPDLYSVPLCARSHKMSCRCFKTISGVSSRDRHWTNWLAMGTILHTWFDHLNESFSPKEVSWKGFPAWTFFMKSLHLHKESSRLPVYY